MSLAPVLASLEIFQDAGIDKLREKSLKLTGYLDYLLRKNFPGRAVSITPPKARAAQISMTIIDPALEPKSVLHKLEAQNVVLDWREPNVIRVAPAPIYNSFEDVYLFSERLENALTY